MPLDKQSGVKNRIVRRAVCRLVYEMPDGAYVGFLRCKHTCDLPAVFPELMQNQRKSCSRLRAALRPVGPLSDDDGEPHAERNNEELKHELFDCDSLRSESVLPFRSVHCCFSATSNRR